MSISSSCYARHANTMKDQWTAKLKEAVDSGDMEQVRNVICEMEEFLFSE